MIEGSLSVGSVFIILLIKGCIKGVALLLDNLTDQVYTWLENLPELGASFDVMPEVNVLAMHLGLDIAVFTVIEPCRAVAVATSPSWALTTSTRATTCVASSKAATPLLKAYI